MKLFDHERLEVFGVAVDFVARAHAMARQLPRGAGDLADQLRRASTSIALNLSEGAGEFSPREKARFYRLAKRSTMECAAIVELYRRLRLREPSEAAAARAELLRIASMLVRLVRAVEPMSAPQPPESA